VDLASVAPLLICPRCGPARPFERSILDRGSCAHPRAPGWAVDRRVRVVGFDVYRSPLSQFIAADHQIPLGSGTVDAVLIQATLEHALDPSQVVTEIVNYYQGAQRSGKRATTY
jgi:hypothetical protein